MKRVNTAVGVAAVFCAVVAHAVVSGAATYYVSTTGIDTNDGSKFFPFKTFDKAMSILGPGDELRLFGGVYKERLVVTPHGTPSHPIRIMPVDGEAVVIDLDYTRSCLVDVPGSYIQIRDIEVRKSTGRAVTLSGSHIEAVNLTVHDAWGHGIYVDGQDVLLDGHEVYRAVLMNETRELVTGFQSGVKVALGGNRVTVQDCTIYNNYGEGICVTRGSNVVVRCNRVYDNYAAQIYVDNSVNVLVERNFAVCRTNSGFEYLNGVRPRGILLGEEAYEGDWGARLSRVRVLNNIVAFCNKSITYGGSDVVGAGGLKDVEILYNTCWGSISTAVSIAHSPYKTEGTVIANNIFHTPCGRSAWVESREGIHMHHNFWVGDPPAAWMNAGGEGDRDGDPGMQDQPGYDPTSFHLNANSHARGGATNLPGILIDFEGKLRSTATSAGTDMGAVEYGSYGTDSDGDGLPDEWEITMYPERTIHEVDPGTDSDGDGATCYEEYIGGTRPTLAGDSLKLSLVSSNSQIHVRFFATKAWGPGLFDKVRLFTLEHTNSLSSGSWIPVSPDYEDIMGTDQTVTYSCPLSSCTFYRIRVRLESR